MDLKKSLYDYVLSKSGGAVLLTPKQLAGVTGISVKQQSVLRGKGTFPIPHKVVGERNVYYPINAVVDCLYDTTATPQPAAKPAHQETKSETSTHRRRNVQDLSHLFNMRAFAARVEAEGNSLLKLSEALVKELDVREFATTLDRKLPRQANATKKRFKA